MKEKHGLRWVHYRGLEKKSGAGDACLCCHELEKTGELPMEDEASSFLFIRIASHPPHFS